MSFLVGIIISCGVAFAGSSPFGYFSVYGYNYKNWCGIAAGFIDGDPYVNGGSTMMTQDYSYVPSGYMGAMVELFEENGYMVIDTPWEYNSGSDYRIESQIASIDSPTVGGYYYARGKSAAFNGNGYSYYYTFRTPNEKVD